MSSPGNYTVGWICALDTEFTAARLMLDKEHDGPEYVSIGDPNSYALDEIGKHRWLSLRFLPGNME